MNSIRFSYKINPKLVLDTLRQRIKYHKACGNVDLVEFMAKRIAKLSQEIEVPRYPGCEVKKIN